MAKCKKIYVEYLEIECIKFENNRMRIAKNYPKYDDYKELYLYELFHHEFLEEKIKNQLSRNFSDYQFYDSFLIELSDREFQEIKSLFEEESDLEKEKWERDVAMLNLAIHVARNDTKTWEV